MEKKLVSLTEILLSFEKYGSRLGMTWKNREIRDYVWSELSGLEKDLKQGSVEIIDLCGRTLRDIQAFLSGYRFKQCLLYLKANKPLYVPVRRGNSPVESRPRWEMNSLIALLDAMISKMSPVALEAARSARKQAIRSFKVSGDLE